LSLSVESLVLGTTATSSAPDPKPRNRAALGWVGGSSPGAAPQTEVVYRPGPARAQGPVSAPPPPPPPARSGRGKQRPGGVYIYSRHLHRWWWQYLRATPEWQLTTVNLKQLPSRPVS
jgi:hypothetical protein